MSLLPTPLSEGLYEYLCAHRSGHDSGHRSLLEELAEETLAMGDISMMQIAPDQGALLTMLVRLMGAGKAVEVGTFTGYSAICIASGLAPGGSLLCCDVSEEWTSMARRYFTRAGLDDTIELCIAPAAETLRALPEEADIDFAFIDADKTGYRDYYEQLLPRMRAGGLIVFDNVLWLGQVAREKDQTEDTVAIRELNDAVVADPRVEAVMISVGDGLLLARKL